MKNRHSGDLLLCFSLNEWIELCIPLWPLLFQFVQQHWLQTISWSVGSSVPSPEDRSTFNYPSLNEMRQKLPTAVHLCVCIVLPVCPDPSVWPFTPSPALSTSSAELFTFLQVADVAEAARGGERRREAATAPRRLHSHCSSASFSIFKPSFPEGGKGKTQKIPNLSLNTNVSAFPRENV